MDQRFAQPQVPGPGNPAQPQQQPPPQQQPHPHQPKIDFGEFVRELDPTVSIDPESNEFLNKITIQLIDASLKESSYVAKMQKKTVIDNECIRTAWQVLNQNYKSQSRSANAPKPEPTQNHKRISEIVKNFQANKHHSNDN